MNVADYVAALVQREGSEFVFTVPGGTALPLLEAIAKLPQIRVVVCKDEQGAAYMADGHAWSSGKPGIVITIGGPGATNALTGLCCASAQGNPLILVSGEVSRNALGRRSAQDGSAFAIDVTAASRPATVLSVAVGSTDEAMNALEEAFRRALRLRRPVHVSLPLDVQRGLLPELALREPTAVDDLRGASTHGVARAVVALRTQGQRVAILAGGGAAGAAREILDLAELLAAPVATTCAGKGIFPELHPLSLGVFSFGAGPLARAALTSGVDTLLAVGTGLGEFATMNFSPKLAPRGRLIHVDHDPTVLGRNYDCLPVCGDAREVCRGLLSGLAGERRASASAPAWLTWLKQSAERVFEPAHAESAARPIRPERLMRELERALPADACVLADIGTSCLFVAHCLRFTPPQRCYLPMAWSCMGHPLGAALGVRLGSGKPTVCVAGDAAFLAKGLELHAAVELGIARFVWVVLSNRGHGLVRAGTAALVNGDRRVEDGTFKVQPDVAAIASAVGAEGIRVVDPNELQAALAHGLGCGRPCVIDVKVDPDAVPPMAERLQGLAQGAASPTSTKP